MSEKRLLFEFGVAPHLEKFQTVANYTEYISTAFFSRIFFHECQQSFFVEFDHSALQCVILE
jgi:hypothetical protein